MSITLDANDNSLSSLTKLMANNTERTHCNKMTYMNETTHEPPTDLTEGMTFPKSGGDKPTKFTARNIRRLLEAISNGMTVRSACIVAGIAPSTLTNYRREHPELVERIDKAREIAREKMLKIIQVAAINDWRAAAEYLKLVYGEDYRRAGQPAIQANSLQVNQVILPPDLQDQLVAQHERLMATRARQPSQVATVLDVEAQPAQLPASATEPQPEPQPEPEPVMEPSAAAPQSALYRRWAAAKPTSYEDTEQPRTNRGGVPRLL